MGTGSAVHAPMRVDSGDRLSKRLGAAKPVPIFPRADLLFAESKAEGVRLTAQDRRLGAYLPATLGHVTLLGVRMAGH